MTTDMDSRPSWDSRAFLDEYLRQRSAPYGYKVVHQMRVRVFHNTVELATRGGVCDRGRAQGLPG